MWSLYLLSKQDSAPLCSCHYLYLGVSVHRGQIPAAQPGAYPSPASRFWIQVITVVADIHFKVEQVNMTNMGKTYVATVDGGTELHWFSVRVEMDFGVGRSVTYFGRPLCSKHLFPDTSSPPHILEQGGEVAKRKKRQRGCGRQAGGHPPPPSLTLQPAPAPPLGPALAPNLL